MKFYNCPNCGVSIPDKGDKIIKHKTFCKSSYDGSSTGSLTGHSTIETLSELLAMDLTVPPWKVTVSKKPETGIKITLKSHLSTQWLFFLPRLLIPAAIFVLYLIFNRHLPPIPLQSQDIISILIVLGIIASLFLLSLISGLYGKSELTLKDGKGTFFTGIGKLGQTRSFSYTKNSSVNVVMPSHAEEPHGSYHYHRYRRGPSLLFFFMGLNSTGIIVTTNGKKVAFGGTLPRKDVIKYMAAYTLREIHKLT
jgi:hypothetical protein